jgi:hypothetical protein
MELGKGGTVERVQFSPVGARERRSEVTDSDGQQPRNTTESTEHHRTHSRRIEKTIFAFGTDVFRVAPSIP